MKSLTSLTYIVSLLLLPSIVWAEEPQDEAEPVVQGSGVVELIQQDSLDGWKVPSDRWSIKQGTIIGDTGGKELTEPEWIYTDRKFADFILTCEVRLTGEHKPNSGLYFRVKPFSFKWRDHQYEAPSGYEYDILSGKHCGSLGDWYARPKLRIFADRKLTASLYQEADWNRITIRARDNRIEYWMNGKKIVDYIDEDPKRSPAGLIGLQIHDRAIMKVDLRNARVLPL